MDKIMLAIEWIKAHYDVIAFVVLYLIEQILPKINSIDANSMFELIFNLIVKLVKKDYSQPKKDEPVSPT